MHTANFILSTRPHTFQNSPLIYAYVSHSCCICSDSPFKIFHEFLIFISITHAANFIIHVLVTLTKIKYLAIYQQDIRVLRHKKKRSNKIGILKLCPAEKTLIQQALYRGKNVRYGLSVTL